MESDYEKEKMNGEAIRICPGCNCKVEMSLLEYPELYDGWIEYLCPKCHTRVGRWSGKVMAKGEYEDPILRLKEEKWTIKK